MRRILVGLLVALALAGCTDIAEASDGRVTSAQKPLAAMSQFEQQRVAWYLAARDTAAKQWYAGVISNEPASRCIANHESARSGLYFAENAVSTASGKYQFLDSTWRRIAEFRGRPDLPAHAASAAPWEQDLSFWFAWNMPGGHGHWRGCGCG